MTTGDTRQRALADEARELLQLPQDADRQAARRRALQLLEETHWTPPVAASEAIQLLCGAPSEASGCEQLQLLTEGRAARLRREIDRFRQRFFKIPPPERKLRWERLRGQAEGMLELQARLDVLLPGLLVDVNCWSLPDAAGQLLEAVPQMFTASPHERADLRRQYRELARSEPAKWQHAARQVQQQTPEIAQLCPEFVAELADWKRLTKRRERNAQRRRNEYERARTAGNTNWRALVVVFCLVVIGAVIGIINRGNNRNNSSVRSPKFSYQPPRNTDEVERAVLEMMLSHYLTDAEIERDERVVKANPEDHALRFRLAETRWLKAMAARDSKIDRMRHAAAAWRHSRRLIEVDAGKLSYQQVYLKSAWQFADQLAKESPEQAIHRYQQAIAIGRAAIGQHADDNSIRRSQAALLNNLARQQLRKNQPDLAAQNLSESLAHAKYLFDTEPGEEPLKRLNRMFGNLCEAYIAAEQPHQLAATARQWSKAADHGAEALHKIARELAAAAQLLQAAPADDDHHSLVLALADESLDLLKKAKQKGADLSGLQDDLLFKVVRDRPGAKALLPADVQDR